MNKLSDCWRTPDELFKQLDNEFNFQIDLCSTKENSKCEIGCHSYLTVNELIIPNQGACFMNPPYSNPYPFVAKAWEDSKHCKIVLLLKVDTSTKWWQIFWDYELNEHYCPDWDYMLIDKGTDEWAACTCSKKYNGPKPGSEVRFLRKRVHFDPPQELVNSGEVWKIKDKWVCKCAIEDLCGKNEGFINCYKCKGKGYAALSGPSFPICVVIMDRRRNQYETDLG